MEQSRAGLGSAARSAADAAGAAGPEAPSQTAACGRGETGRRALLAAVDPAMLRQCHTVLESLGIAVTAVDTGIAVLVAGRQDRPDLILVDGQLRDVPGREVVKWLRSDPGLQATPIIFLAVNGETAPLDRQDPLPRKPVSAAALRRMIGEVLR